MNQLPQIPDPIQWYEGMLLTPQHFQQWDRALHHMVAQRFRAAQAFEWGLTRLEIDREALRKLLPEETIVYLGDTAPPTAMLNFFKSFTGTFSQPFRSNLFFGVVQARACVGGRCVF